MAALLISHLLLVASAFALLSKVIINTSSYEHWLWNKPIMEKHMLEAYALNIHLSLHFKKFVKVGFFFHFMKLPDSHALFSSFLYDCFFFVGFSDFCKFNMLYYIFSVKLIILAILITWLANYLEISIIWTMVYPLTHGVIASATLFK